MTDRRGVWLTIVSTAAAAGAGAAVAGIVAHIPFVWIVGLIVLVASVLGFTSLLSGWPIASLGKSDLPLPAVSSNQDEVLPTFMIPTYASDEQEMYQLGPYSWLPRIGPRDPDVTLRAIVASPAVSARDYGAELATAVRGDARESWLIDLLNSAELTTWLKKPWEPGPWPAEPTWHVHGSGMADLTELVFVPTLEPMQVLPFLARCAVLTGWRPTASGTKIKALRFLVELQFDRGAGAGRLTDPSADPDIAKLSLDEIAQDFVRLLDALDLSSQVGDYLLPQADLNNGYFGLWLSVRGVMMEQIVDLAGITRLTGAVSRADAVVIGSWQRPGGPVGKTQGIVVADMLDELLEGAGYRGVADRFDWLR